MVEMNLLPWREFQKIQQARRQLLMLVFIMLLLLGGYIFYLKKQPIHQANIEKTIDSSIEQVKQIHYAGYIHEAKRIWALISFPNSKTQAVQVGSSIYPQVRVLKITENELKLLLPSKQFYSLFLS